MLDLIEANRPAIESLCHRHHVTRLEVFGSAASGAFDPARSDVDFLVEFERTDVMDAADQYFGLLEELERLFGRRVDLVCAKAMRNPYFIRAVEESRRLLYETAPLRYSVASAQAEARGSLRRGKEQ